MTVAFRNQKSIDSKVNGNLIFRKKMTSKLNGFSIYSNGIIELNGRIAINNRINIPKELTQWITITVPSKILTLKIKSHSSSTDYLLLSTKTIKITNTFYFQLLNTTNLQQGELVICQIELMNSSCFTLTERYQKALALLKTIQLPSLGSISPLLKGGKGNRTFTIYKDTNGLLFIKADGILTDGGAVSLSKQLGHYIEDWFKKSDFVLASKDDEEAMIIETRIIRQNTGRKLEKCLYFPHIGKRKPITVFFSSPDFELTTIAKKEIQVISLLKSNGIPLKTLKSNSSALGNHCDVSYEVLVRDIVKRFATTRDLILLPEVLFNFINPAENDNGNSKIVDAIAANKQLNFLMLCEIKTSDKTLSSELEFAIADLLHTTRKLNELANVFPFLFINQDVLRLNARFQITKQYGLSCGILLIGLSDTIHLRSSPDLLIDYMSEYTKKQTLLTENKSSQIHPITGEVVTKIELQNDALKCLSLITSWDSPKITEYCLLMCISVTDFKLLYSHIKEITNIKSQQTNVELGVISEKIIEPNRDTLFQMIHTFLVEKDYFGILALKYQLTQNPNLLVLLQHQQQLQEKLPISIKIFDIKNRRGDGTTYEQEIRKRLKAEGYQVASNVFLSNISKPFEIDHIALQNDKMTLVSCKDRSNISYEPDLPHLIKEAANILEFRKKLLNADQAILYVKVNKEFLKNQQSLFEVTPWIDNVEIHIE